jgi:hypothetical protein
MTFPFRGVVAVLVLLGAALIAAAHDHATGWGTAVGTAAVLHNVWRQIRIEQRVASYRQAKVDTLAPKSALPPYWPPEWRRVA